MVWLSPSSTMLFLFSLFARNTKCALGLPLEVAVAYEQLATNWYSIASHLQNPTLYSAEWAHNCDYNTKTNRLVSNRPLRRGEVASLLPIHAVGITGFPRRGKDWLVFDAGRDQDYFAPRKPAAATGFAKSTNKRNREYRYRILDGTNQHPQLDPELLENLFCDVNPQRELQSGWLGHLASRRGNNHAQQDEANCFVVPLAAPLCALVVCQDIESGTTLLSSPNPAPKSVIDALWSYHPQELRDLREYMNMAYPVEDPTPEQSLLCHDDSLGTPAKRTFRTKSPFYELPREYPGIITIHKDPDILSIPNFLTADECDRLIAKARPHLIPCVVKNPTTGDVEQDPSRTSRNTNVPQSEVPSIVERLTKLANCKPEQLEILQVLHYAPGQYFDAHTDGFLGPMTACGFRDSARLVTIFCYLNDVPRGGATRFPDLGLEVAPSKGMAVIHFPTTLGFEEDLRTQHEGMVAIDEKWLLVTWVWMHARDSTSAYNELNLNPLSTDQI